MPFLNDCAAATGGTPTQIDYPTLVAANRGDLQLLQQATIPNVNALLRRQAALQALDAEGRGADVANWCAGGNTGNPAFLASIGLAIRSSHSGAPIDNGLPQGPYLAAPPGGLLGIRGRANYAWLEESTTPHTTQPDVASGLAADPARVASYFELHIDRIRSRGQVALDGGRVVYDPFAHRFFVSAHYLQEFELINVPAVTADPVYAPLRLRIQNFAAALPAGGPPWITLYATLAGEMQLGQL